VENRLYLTEGTDKVVKFTGYPRHAFQKIYHQARRERGQSYPGPKVMGAPRIFLWGHSNFLDEIFLLFGQSTDINHGKNWKNATKAIKAYSSGKFFENNLPRAPDKLSAALSTITRRISIQFLSSQIDMGNNMHSVIKYTRKNVFSPFYCCR
jgi:hypothetical protein